MTSNLPTVVASDTVLPETPIGEIMPGIARVGTGISGPPQQ